MDDYSKPKATLVIKVLEHETLTGADGEQHLDFDDSVNAINGLIGWLAQSLAETEESDKQTMGTELLVAALYGWTFNEHSGESDETDELLDDDDSDDDDFDDDTEELDEDEPGEFPSN